jgi:hypothetical protein
VVVVVMVWSFVLCVFIGPLQVTMSFYQVSTLLQALQSLECLFCGLLFCCGDYVIGTSSTLFEAFRIVL